MVAAPWLNGPILQGARHVRTAIEAKNRFGRLCAQAKRKRVFVERAGHPVDNVAAQASALASAMDAVVAGL